jgi:hypothetical protein
MHLIIRAATRGLTVAFRAPLMVPVLRPTRFQFFQRAALSSDFKRNITPMDTETELLSIKMKIGQHYTAGQYEKALELAVEMQMKIEESMGTQNSIYASALNNVALMCKMSFDFERAVEVYTEALQVYDNVVGRRHPSYMVTLSNLGAAYIAFAGTKTGMEKLQLMERASEALHDAHEYHKDVLGSALL